MSLPAVTPCRFRFIGSLAPSSPLICFIWFCSNCGLPFLAHRHPVVSFTLVIFSTPSLPILHTLLLSPQLLHLCLVLVCGLHSFLPNYDYIQSRLYDLPSSLFADLSK
ncbi:hypothetical protein BCR44DRAFT_1430004 [Catenaria anguillulae PL171]|uniref:Uncharacterized protein n=1 Tax=Catenaria anguillulae PL171 TaxID=765915 RepID=A0A1Y2HTC1_9FUNG|nr:hypothetical protein BCR44DRAFT_1430004 [Catenaria anguillulae PL171]